VSKFLSIAGVLAALLLASPATAAPVDNQIDRLQKHVDELTHQVVSFFGFGANQVNNPTDPQPLVLPPRPELKARAIEPAAVAELAMPDVPPRRRSWCLPAPNGCPAAMWRW
jgi:hypothetical protein